MTQPHQISDFIVENNNQYIVAQKPAGMPCVPDQSGDKNLKNLLEAYSKHDLHILTRIDRPVSGLCLLAKSQNAAKHLSNQIKGSGMEKTYLAIVEKSPPESSAQIEHYLMKGRNNKAMIVEEGHKGAKKAILSYETIVKLDNYTVLKIELKTGRFHQIRSQLAYIGCPIKGDVKYGARRKNKDRSIYLHAYQLTFAHPVTQEQKMYQVLPNQEDTLWKIAGEELGS